MILVGLGDNLALAGSGENERTLIWLGVVVGLGKVESWSCVSVAGRVR
jgi:hypothetical protein